MKNKITNEQVERLIALALRPDLQIPTDAEIEQFITEFDEGKHPLSDADKDALATSGFRQYLKANVERDRLKTERKAQIDFSDSLTAENRRLKSELETLRQSVLRTQPKEGDKEPDRPKD